MGGAILAYLRLPVPVKALVGRFPVGRLLRINGVGAARGGVGRRGPAVVQPIANAPREGEDEEESEDDCTVFNSTVY